MDFSNLIAWVAAQPGNRVSIDISEEAYYDCPEGCYAYRVFLAEEGKLFTKIDDEHENELNDKPTEFKEVDEKSPLNAQGIEELWGEFELREKEKKEIHDTGVVDWLIAEHKGKLLVDVSEKEPYCQHTVGDYATIFVYHVINGEIFYDVIDEHEMFVSDESPASRKTNFRPLPRKSLMFVYLMEEKEKQSKARVMPG